MKCRIRRLQLGGASMLALQARSEKTLRQIRLTSVIELTFVAKLGKVSSVGVICEMDAPLRILIITSAWPTPEHPDWGPFIVLQVEVLRMAGLQVDVFPFRGGKNPVCYLRAWYQVRRCLRRKPYDLIHAHFGQSGLLAFPKRIPLVVTFHGSDLEGIIGSKGQDTFAGHVLRSLSKVVASSADEIIVVSASLAKHLPKRCSFHVIPGGVDLDLFKPLSKKEAREALKLPQDRYLVLFGGRIQHPDAPRKRYDLARQAVDHLRSQYDVDLVVTRDVPHDVMPLYMNACDVLLLTSLHEGSPTVVKEALACNLPVVSVAVGDVRERIGSIPGCIVCDDDRSETIAAGLVNVLSRNIPFNSRNVAEKELDERMLAKKVIDVYHLIT
jgi:teichuronic acid biosynthesis glycosyltransferase TuaC